MDTLNAFTGLVRRCCDDYRMIQAGDRIAVGVSGGKDSLVLLMALRHLQTYYPAPFHLEAIVVDLGFPGMDYSPVEALCRRLEVPCTVIKTDIREIVFDARKEENPCSLCSKMRRGALNTAARERGLGKLALGHHFDDAVETFLMSLLFEGRLSCFKPVTYMSRAGSPRSGPCSTPGSCGWRGWPRRWSCRWWRTPVRRTRRPGGGRSSSCCRRCRDRTRI